MSSPHWDLKTKENKKVYSPTVKRGVMKDHNMPKTEPL
jgi:hypothetical protein